VEGSTMPKTRIIRKRSNPKKNKRGTMDYESPYAEYLLGAIKEPEKGMKGVSNVNDPMTKVTNEVRLQKIKSIYNDTNSKNRAGRAQSPITGAMLMIHESSIMKTSEEGGKIIPYDFS
jgi:hypothetical protein